VPLALLLVLAIRGGHGRAAGVEAAAGEPAASEAPPQSAPVGGPSLGVLYDAGSRALRRVAGIPGAATIGQPLATPAPLVEAWVSPLGDYAIAEVEGAGDLVLLALDREPIDSRPLGVAAGVTRAAVSPRGSAAVLYRRESRTLRVITGLPAAPEVQAEVDVSALPLSVRSLAVSDDGTVLVGVLERQDGLIHVLDGGGLGQVGARFGDPAAIAFRPGSRDALVADRRDNRVCLIREAGRLAAVEVLAGAEAGIAQPVGVAASNQGGRVFVANSASRTITVLDYVSHTVQQIPSPAATAGLDRMGRTGLFCLNGISAQALLLFDGEDPEPRVVFVPPPISSESPRE
jgi:DNA-binding beta-propeller fold protein YncE